MKASCADVVSVPLQSLHASFGLVVPDLDQLVVCTADQIRPVTYHTACFVSKRWACRTGPHCENRKGRVREREWGFAGHTSIEVVNAVDALVMPLQREIWSRLANAPDLQKLPSMVWSAGALSWFEAPSVSAGLMDIFGSNSYCSSLQTRALCIVVSLP